MTTWTNADGLIVKFNKTGGEVVTDGASAVGSERTFTVVLDSQDLPAIATGGRKDIASIPAGALITSAYLRCDTAFTGTGTLTIGFAKSDGTALDADGIDASVDVDSVLAAAGDVVTCDGALVDGTEEISEEAWVYAANGGTVSAGVATLTIRYVL